MDEPDRPEELRVEREQVNFDALTIRASSVSRNVDQEVLVTTRDKVELALRRELPRYVPTGEFLAVLGVFLTFLITVMTATFSDFLALPGQAWRGIFIVSTIAGGVWLVVSLVKLIRRPSMDKLVDAIAHDATRE
ncbi:hypothetical protein SCB71_14315 [Herbiconiux sp. KACC 21604]|uniref:hypothetical protein n=1 Tax=unclassified Herbiconiux TaxID=2618217 RepID=UPI001492708E|nr:hypothetical protein [Herbiconiux sp. SALV-R1]QJU54316.1 hypothetical protein HL652_12255 [Herbiconiux sp. SALV-R1]WPO85386.1 hypothetical protein SCB71_14315 [Herbiconiux sp. KACC 21604]